MNRYKVINYSNIMGECGYEVNDAHYTGQEVELPNPPTLRQIMDALKGAEVCGKHCQLRWLDIDNEHTDIYIRQRSNGKWLWELRLIRD
jgi:hypothetical protein